MIKLFIIINILITLTSCQFQNSAPNVVTNPQTIGHQFSFSNNNNINQLTTQRPFHPPAQVHYVNIGQNLAGDYKFGYDTGKGPAGQSFREEVRQPDGSVRGAYGYIDANGKMRIVKYSAGKEGYQVESDQPAESARPSQTAPQAAPQPQPQLAAIRAAPQPQQSAPLQLPPQQSAPLQLPPQHQRQAILPQQTAPQQFAPQAPAQPQTIPLHSLQQLQQFNRQLQPPLFRSAQQPSQLRPAQPQPAQGLSVNNFAGFNSVSTTTQEPTWGPPVIPVELLNYNIGVRQ